MKPRTFKWVAVLLFIAALGAAMFWLALSRKTKEVPAPAAETPKQEAATTTAPAAETPKFRRETIGKSVEGRIIEAYTFGTGKNRLVFVGGIHGGYEWNSVLLAYKFIDYLEEDPGVVPESVSVTIVPNANPDGVFAVAGKEGRFAAGDVPDGFNGNGRFNARKVDLNRNFDCNWKAAGVWQGKSVSGGNAAFSEPEAQAIRDCVLEDKPAAVVFWHSQSNAIYGSMCNSDLSPETKRIMDVYSKASGYKTVETFDGYQVTGDASDWLASIGIPAMTVELATHESIEWDKNLAGIKALFEYFANTKQ